jgi:polar amino acid transport system permease protein
MRVSRIGIDIPGSPWKATLMAQLASSEKPPSFRNSVEFRAYMALKIRTAPWWLIGIFAIAIVTAITIITNQAFKDAFLFIKAGLGITISTTLTAFLFAVVLGLITGLGRISNSTFSRNLATLYVEIIRGIPMLVLIFFIALVGVPAVVDGLKELGTWFTSIGFIGMGKAFSGLENNGVPMNTRAIIALSVTYGAFLAEIFRAGIQSIGRGQMEAARSQGMSYWQAMRYIILPQAIRNVLPALGNDFISMLKDSSLVSVLAVRDITQIARLYAGRSFQYREAYITLAVLYLTMTILLSFVLKFTEKWTKKNEQR